MGPNHGVTRGWLGPPGPREHGRRHRRSCAARTRREVAIEATAVELEPALATEGRPGRLSRPIAFAAIAAIFVIFAAAASAPTPLYVVYQKEWGFPTSTLTLVFAVYVFGLIGSLLVLGGLADHVGRRPVLGAAIALEAVAFVLFFVAGGVTVLLVARVAQGIATGMAFSTLGATLVD